MLAECGDAEVIVLKHGINAKRGTLNTCNLKFVERSGKDNKSSKDLSNKKYALKQRGYRLFVSGQSLEHFL